MTASPSTAPDVAQRVEPRERNRSRPRSGSMVPRSAFALRNARRTRNREAGAFREQLRCECARPDCHATFPALAEAHRRDPGRFIIAPDHFAGETVVAAADRFFVVDQHTRSAVRIAR
jgi:hypothetical protein